MKKALEDAPTFEKIKPQFTRSRPNISRFRTCSGKLSFSKPRALHTAEALTKRHGVKKDLRVYRCPTCRRWHLTSMPRKHYRKYVEAARRI